MLARELVCEDAGLRLARHPILNLYMSIFFLLFTMQIIWCYKFFGYQIHGHVHEFKTVHGGGQVHVAGINAHVFGTFSVHDTVPNDLGGH